MKHEGKIALVTGGTRGIGKAISLRLASEGADIILNYKSDSDTAEATAAEIRELGRRVWVMQADLRGDKNVRALGKQITTEVGQLDIFIHNAAFGTMGPILRMGMFSWRAAMDINVNALLLMTQQLAPLLQKRGGWIVGLSSIGADMTFSEYACIGVSKAAMEALCRYIAYELAPLGIRCNAVSAGPIKTRALDWFEYPSAVDNYAETKSPLHRMGTPDDLTGVVSFLCTPDADWIVGQIIRADGGISLGENFMDWLSPEQKAQEQAKKAKKAAKAAEKKAAKAAQRA
jgi:NAD(P)-dependent dehydrogenase (short-subunit alcohol dehydrogenase family)